MAKAKAKSKKKAAPKGRKSAQEIASAKAKTSKISSDAKKNSNKVIKDTKSKNAKITKDYENGKAYKNASKAQDMTINDIGKKYGFDFSQEYADQRAETAAQGQRNVYNSQQRTNDSTNKTTMQRISDNYDSAAGDLDKGYFKQYLGTQQSQANRGLNAGIAANQNLQLAMNKQGEVADLWKQRNTNTQEESMRYANQNQTISEALAQVEREKAMNAKQYYQDLLTQGYGILNSDRAAATSWANSEWDRSQSMISNNMGYANMDLDNINNNANRDISTTMDLSKMSIADYYDELDRAEAAAARAAAARVSRGGGGGGRSGGGGGGGSYQKTVLTPAYNGYNKKVQGQKKTPLDKYYGNPIIQNVEKKKTYNPAYKSAFGNRSPVTPADNPNLTAWDKKRMLGL